MNESTTERTLLVYLRILMAWTFLYAASHQLFDPKFSATGFLEHTKTFHAFFVMFASPAIAPVTSLLVEWGHFLIGLSLLVGVMVRVSASFGILLMLTYYCAHMDFPYIENKNNFIVDYHLVYAGVLGLLILKNAGRICGMGGWLANLPMMRSCPRFAAWL